MRVVVTGAEGQLGREIVSLLHAAEYEVFPSDIAHLDIGDNKTIMDAIAHLSPGLIINCAAYTDVDGCEKNRSLADRVNRDGPANLARAAAAAAAIIVHYSTDFVFDGTNGKPYTETDAPHPLSAYGLSKLAGDQAVQTIAPDHLIIRTSWVYGHGPKNFVLSIARQLHAGKKALRVVEEKGSPTYARDLAEATMALLGRSVRGLVNFCNSGECTRLEYAREIARLLGADVEVTPISSEELNLPARRPAYSTLDRSLYKRLTGQFPRPWQTALEDYIKRELV